VVTSGVTVTWLVSAFSRTSTSSSVKGLPSATPEATKPSLYVTGLAQASPAVLASSANAMIGAIPRRYVILTSLTDPVPCEPSPVGPG
jgi:hypothetical protein